MAQHCMAQLARLGVSKIANLEAEGRPARQQAVLQLEVAVAHALQQGGATAVQPCSERVNGAMSHMHAACKATRSRLCLLHATHLRWRGTRRHLTPAAGRSSCRRSHQQRRELTLNGRLQRSLRMRCAAREAHPGTQVGTTGSSQGQAGRRWPCMHGQMRPPAHRASSSGKRPMEAMRSNSSPPAAYSMTMPRWVGVRKTCQGGCTLVQLSSTWPGSGRRVGAPGLEAAVRRRPPKRACKPRGGCGAARTPMRRGRRHASKWVGPAKAPRGSG